MNAVFDARCVVSIINLASALGGLAFANRNAVAFSSDLRLFQDYCNMALFFWYLQWMMNEAWGRCCGLLSTVVYVDMDF